MWIYVRQVFMISAFSLFFFFFFSPTLFWGVVGWGRCLIGFIGLVRSTSSSSISCPFSLRSHPPVLISLFSLMPCLPKKAGGDKVENGAAAVPCLFVTACAFLLRCNLLLLLLLVF